MRKEFSSSNDWIKWSTLEKVVVLSQDCNALLIRMRSEVLQGGTSLIDFNYDFCLREESQGKHSQNVSFGGEIQAVETWQDLEAMRERLQLGIRYTRFPSEYFKIHENCFQRANVRCIIRLDNLSVWATSTSGFARCLWPGVAKYVVSGSPRSVERKLVMLDS